MWNPECSKVSMEPEGFQLAQKPTKQCQTTLDHMPSTVVTMDMPDVGIYQNLVGIQQTHVGIYHVHIPV